MGCICKHHLGDAEGCPEHPNDAEESEKCTCAARCWCECACGVWDDTIDDPCYDCGANGGWDD